MTNDTKKNIELTPMMQQYFDIKAQYPDAILFFRLGDFYEMFFEDAVLVAKELNLTLTSRSGDKDKLPMCGVPYHAAEGYIQKLIDRGYKVAIGEQIGDPKAKGLTKREVIQVITPGTILTEAALSDVSNHYIVLVREEGDLLALAAADVSTGECLAAVYTGKDRAENLFDELYRLSMRELLLVGELSFRAELDEFLALRMSNCTLTNRAASADVESRLIEHFSKDVRPTDPQIQVAVATLLDYLHDTLKADLSHVNRIAYLDAGNQLVLDTYTLRNLEITRNLRDGGKKDTLYAVLDFTKTAMGSRLLKQWLEHPLLSILEIEARLASVAECKEQFSLRMEIREALSSVYDFERILTRIEVATANARDLVALRQSMEVLPALERALRQAKSALLQNLAHIDTYDDLVDVLGRAIVDTPGLSVREGGIIREGYHEELDMYRALARDSKALLQDMEERERASTGIKTLKIGYNKVFGYYIEVRHSGTDLVPDRYIRKQTLANAERYITEELKEFETKILGAEEKSVQLEYAIFTELREKIKGELMRLQDTAQKIAKIDVLQALAEAAANYGYERPMLKQNGEIRIRDGRHPLVERILSGDLFVPNDTEINHRDSEIMLITGPNMAGKSTYMRQVALLTLMAQVGCFVPAREAVISPVDRIFTRIGASDDLVSGQSTFMVEMNEVAQILKHATENSLVILDEIGRGTSTFDGMSIARAVIEHIHDRIHAKTLFATHYHELTDMENDKIKNYSVAVKERGKKVDFLRRIVPGGADKSYGIHVARLAGLPASVTTRAESILAKLEVEPASRTSISGTETAAAPEKDGREQVQPAQELYMNSLFADGLKERLLSLDVMTLTPIEAMNELYKLQQEARKEEGK
ncbi:DNA mismatch repair protein MutS [Selenomonas sp. TAMA-11512]|uniref:DNA mismatch repair protein MutS n=1 Tax=Selenomonas sp. TAMA-11512 TaxID=3095337 RepID=UPI00308DFE11|nr:DNA mismatch repair protein MutS [Selenomonas sp. TAMA-11512]